MAASDTSALWSKFYHVLNCEAAKLRELMKEAGLDSPSPNADPTRPVRADHNGQQRHFTRKSGGGESWLEL